MSEARMARLARDRYTVLLEIAQIVASHHTLEELFRDLAPLLHSSIQFQYLTLVLHDEERDVMRMHTLEGTGLRMAQAGTEFSMAESASAWVWQRPKPWARR